LILSKGVIQMLKYKVVRSYDYNECADELQEAFDDGWQFLRASEYVPSIKFDNILRYGYIEYILYKDGDTDGKDADNG